MTPERAKYLLQNRQPYGELKFGYKQRNHNSAAVYADGITVAEDAAIKAMWNTMGGHTTYTDALVRLSKGFVTIRINWDREPTLAEDGDKY